MRYIKITQEAHAMIEAMATPFLNDHTTVYLPDGEIQILVDDQVIEFLRRHKERKETMSQTIIRLIRTRWENEGKQVH